MSWNIHLISCDVKVSKKVAKELKALDENEIFDEDWEGGELRFNCDHMEWADWLSNHEELVEVLKKAKVKGRVLWCSHEGDNAGDYWGHEFDGKGGYFYLTGNVGGIVWTRNK